MLTSENHPAEFFLQTINLNESFIFNANNQPISAQATKDCQPEE